MKSMFYMRSQYGHFARQMHHEYMYYSVVRYSSFGGIEADAFSFT